MTKRKRAPRKVWFHHNNGELWPDPFFSEESARKSLTKDTTLNARGDEVTLHRAGWRVVGPYIR